MDPETEEELRRWRATPMQEGDIPFEEAVDSLFTSDALIEIRPQTPSRWTVFRKGTDDAAVLSYAMLFSKSDDYFTGNLAAPLPRGQRVPVEEAEGDRVEYYANFKCHYAYAFDTYHDKSIWDIIRRLEEFGSLLPGFARENVDRRPYDSPVDAGNLRRCWMRAPMFVRVKRGERKGSPASHLHPRVINADRHSTVYSASPARPTVYTFDEATGVFTEVLESGVLLTGDIVVVAFTVSFVIGANNWFTEFIPAEIVRVSPEPVDAPPTPDINAPPLVARKRLDRRDEPPLLETQTSRPDVAQGPSPRSGPGTSAGPGVVPTPSVRPERSQSIVSVSGIASSVAAMEVDDSGLRPAGERPTHEDDDLSEFVFPDPPGTGASPSPSSSFVHPGMPRDSRKTDSEDSQSSAGSPAPRGPGTKRKRPDGITSEHSASGSGLLTDDEDSGDVGSRRTRKAAARSRR